MKYKTNLIIVLILSLMFAVSPVGSATEQDNEILEPTQTSFSDVNQNHEWANDAIEYFHQNGITAGTGEGKFSPDESITREQYAKIIAALFNMTVYTENEQTFSDVDSTMWSYTYIEAVKQYLTGYYPYGLYITEKYEN